jgi:hypothetical protein
VEKLRHLRADPLGRTGDQHDFLSQIDFNTHSDGIVGKAGYGARFYAPMFGIFSISPVLNSECGAKPPNR